MKSNKAMMLGIITLLVLSVGIFAIQLGDFSITGMVVEECVNVCINETVGETIKEVCRLECNKTTLEIPVDDIETNESEEDLTLPVENETIEIPINETEIVEELNETDDNLSLPVVNETEEIEDEVVESVELNETVEEQTLNESEEELTLPIENVTSEPLINETEIVEEINETTKTPINGSEEETTNESIINLTNKEENRTPLQILSANQPQINLDWVYPTANTTVPQNSFFNLTVNVSCFNQDCNNLNVTLDPTVTYNFTPCNKAGKAGPNQSDCDTFYTGTTLAGGVTVEEGIQYWTVPTGGSYTFTVAGAQGGNASRGQGGRGRVINATVSLTAGQVLKIVVGQKGGSISFATGDSGGGGGGTFIVDNATGRIILIAGGGGGAGDGHSGQFNYYAHGRNASPMSWTNGSDGVQTGGSWNARAVGGVNGLGGSVGSGGASGAGFYGNGTKPTYGGGAGIAFISNCSGGINLHAATVLNNVQGGFGSGAGGYVNSGFECNGGAGGGYSGGGGSGTRVGAGGGGGNFVNTSYASNELDAGLNVGDGYIVITGGSAKGGTVSTTEGTTPFYTNTTNPYNLSLTTGQSQTITWYVNATGDIDTAYEFFTYANITTNDSIHNKTQVFNITIVDDTAPKVNITYPSNTTYSVTLTDLNYTQYDKNKDSCWYSTDNGDTNSTGVTADNNFTGLSSSAGSNNWTVYCNDSSGNVGYDTVTFNSTIPVINVSLVYPTTHINVSEYEFFNVTVNLSCTNNDCGEINVSLDPATITVVTLDDFDGESTCSDTCGVSCSLVSTNWSNVVTEPVQTRDWVSDKGGTSSSSTGPSVDHTLGNSNGYYLYTESSSSCNLDEYHLVSLPIDTSAHSNLELNFWYHMYGSTMGTLHVDVNESGSWVNDVWNASGNLGDTWFNATVDLSSYTGTINVRFRGITGSSYTSDMAIDDINITSSSATKSGLISTTAGETPFYTNITNPYNISLNQDESAIITWWVNATGDIDTDHEFFVYANKTADMSINAITSRWNTTIKDLTDPVINIIYPVLNDYPTVISKFNYTYSDKNTGHCWYSTNNGTTNSSLVTAGTNFTGLTSVGGGNNWTLYCNDSSGNLVSSSVEFNSSVPVLDLTMVYPTTNISAVQNGFFSISVNLSCSINDCGEVNVSLDPTSNQMTNGDFETGDLTGWTTGGNANWFAQDTTKTEGTYAAQGGDISNSQITWINQSITLSEKSNLSFYWKVSSEGGYDYLLFCNNTVSCTRTSGYVTRIAGTVDWTLKTYVLPAGTQTLHWAYAKDGSLSSGSDIGWIDNVTVSSPTSTKSGLISTTVGDTPFYTTGTNPHNLTINEDETTTITWQVNASGDVNSSHVFFIYANKTADMTINDKTDNWNITILEDTAPKININNIENNGHSNDADLDINFTIISAILDKCWYSNDSMTVNITLASCVNVTNVTWTEGNHNITIYANDTAGSTGSTSLSFTIDLTDPILTMISPENNTQTKNNSLNITFTAADLNLNTCWYSNDTMDLNTTLTSCSNITNVTWVDGQHNVSVWINDSAGNLDWSGLNFTIDATSPMITIIDPTNNTVTADTSLGVNYTVADLNLDSCWYSNDTLVQNNSLASCSNITAATWLEGNHNISIWANDTYANLGKNKLSFTMDTTNPTWSSNKTDLTNATTSGTSVYFNITLADLNPHQYIFSIYNGTSWNNHTASYTNNQEIEITNTTNINVGYINWTFYFNDSAGNSNQSDVWSVQLNHTDLVSPKMNFKTPTLANDSKTANTSIEINLSISEENLKELIYNWNGTNYTIYDDSLFLMYNFDNVSDLGENSTYVVDHSEDRNDGTGTNGAIINSSGKYKRGVYFDGNNDYVNVSSESKFDFGNGESITLSGWVKYDKHISDSGGGGTIISKGEPFSLRAEAGTATNEELEFFYRNSADNAWHIYATTASVLPVNEWKHIAVTYTFGTGSSVKIYINGALEDGSWTTGNGNDAPLNDNNNLLLGRYGTSAIQYFNGTIDEIRIWNRTLSADEVYQQYVSNLNKFNTTQWYFYVNQSKNATTGLKDGTYNYTIYSEDTFENTNQTETRIITVDASAPRINFTAPTLSSGTTTANTSIEVNVSIEESSLNELIYNWNGTNHTMYNESLILMMNFDNISALGENSTYVVDISNNGNNGTGVNGVIINSSGKYSGGAHLDGNDDYVITGADFSELGTNNMNYSFSLWFKAATGETDGDFIHMSSLVSGGGWCLPPVSIDGSKIKGHSWNGAGVSVHDTDTIAANTWYHVANTWDPSGLKIYVNGILKNTTSQTTYSASGVSNYIWVGYGGNGCSGDEGMFNGSIDEVRIWNRSLNADEVYQQYVSNLNKFNTTQWYFYVNQSKNATTGLDDGNYTYQVFSGDDSSNQNQTEQRIVTISSITGPTLTIVSPTTNSFSKDTGLDINYTVSSINLDSCWYSNNSGITNASLTSCVNITSLTWGESKHNVTIWANNTDGESTASVNFTIDTINPALYGVAPDNNSYTNNSELNITYTVSDTNLDSCWYSNDSMTVNITLASCVNITNVTWKEGRHNVTIWANDSAGNMNLSQVNFTIDTINPALNGVAPNNNSYTNNSELNVTYTVSDTNLESCWYSNDSMAVNITLASCVNITNVTWTEGSHNVTVWVNDSAGNMNVSPVNFTIDVTNPTLTFVFPENNSYSNNNQLNINYTVSDANLDSCWYSNDSMTVNITLASCVNITNVTWTEGSHNVTVWANDTANNMVKNFISFIVDLTNPAITVVSPDNNSNTTNKNLDVTYTVSDDNLDSCWYSNDTMSVNITLVSCANITNGTWSIDLHNVTIWSNDSAGNENGSSVNFTVLQDTDGDGITDVDDPLLHNESNVTTSGVSRLNVTVGGNTTNGTFSGVEEVIFYDQNNLMINFSHNFSQSNLDLSNVTITKTDTSLVVNLSGQLQANKTLYITDNNFISLCVKDAEVSSISEVSTGCSGVNETDFTSCLGSNAYLNGINCTDEGTTIKIENLRYSAIRGTVPVSSGSTSSSGGGGSSSGGGGAGPLIEIVETIEEVEVEHECESDLDCEEDKVCYGYQCVKLFDVKLIEISSPLGDDGNLGFTYFIKGMANISGDVVIKFWLEKDGTEISSGQDVIYLGSFEEKTEQTKIYIPQKLEDGSYEFYVQVNYENYQALSHRTVHAERNEETGITLLEKEIKEKFNLKLLLTIYCILIVIFLAIVIYRYKRNKILEVYHKIKLRRKTDLVKEVGDPTREKELEKLSDVNKRQRLRKISLQIKEFKESVKEKSKKVKRKILHFLGLYKTAAEIKNIEERRLECIKLRGIKEEEKKERRELKRRDKERRKRVRKEKRKEKIKEWKRRVRSYKRGFLHIFGFYKTPTEIKEIEGRRLECLRRKEVAKREKERKRKERKREIKAKLRKVKRRILHVLGLYKTPAEMRRAEEKRLERIRRKEDARREKESVRKVKEEEPVVIVKVKKKKIKKKGRKKRRTRKEILSQELLNVSKKLDDYGNVKKSRRGRKKKNILIPLEEVKEIKEERKKEQSLVKAKGSQKVKKKKVRAADVDDYSKKIKKEAVKKEITKKRKRKARKERWEQELLSINKKLNEYEQEEI